MNLTDEQRLWIEADISPFLDERGFIAQWPAKPAKKFAVTYHLGHAFKEGRRYTEREINEIIQANHTFNDYFLLRRELVEWGVLCRTRDGSAYWKA